MGRFRESKDFEQVPMEEEMVRWWEAEDIFRKSIESRQGRKRFTFYEGPPTANGRPGIHHVLARTIKDIFCRYRTMRGYLVQRKAGWDTHGLPVEIEVEKELQRAGQSNRSQSIAPDRFRAEFQDEGSSGSGHHAGCRARLVTVFASKPRGKGALRRNRLRSVRLTSSLKFVLFSIW